MSNAPLVLGRTAKLQTSSRIESLCRRRNRGALAGAGSCASAIDAVKHAYTTTS